MKVRCFDTDKDGICDQCQRSMNLNLRGRACKAFTSSKQGRISNPATAIRNEVKKGLGTQIRNFLILFGITKERYLEFKKNFGALPLCLCDEREEWLNNFGKEFGTSAVKAISLIYPSSRRTNQG